MSNTRKRIGSLLVACLLIASALCGPSAAADGLLEAMIDSALRADKTIEATLRIEAGELLSSFVTDGCDTNAAPLIAAGHLLDNGLLRARYTKLGERDVVGLTLEMQGKAILTLDARTQGGEIALETSLLPSRTLIVPAEFGALAGAAQIPGASGEDLLEVLAGAAARYGEVVANWAAQNEGVLSASEQPIPATQTRDAAARSDTLRLTDAQGLDLIRALAQAFAEDDALRETLAEQTGMTPADLAAAALQLADSLGAPQGSALEATIYGGEAGEVVGIDARIEPAASSPDALKPAQGSASYSHRSIDADHSSDSLEVDLFWGEDSELRAEFYRSDKIPRQFLPNEGEDYGGRARLRTPDSGALDLEVSGSIVRTVEPVNESTKHTFGFRLSQAVENADTSDLGALLQAPLLDVGFTQSNQTEVVGMDGFQHTGSFALRLMGQTATIHHTLASIEHAPAEHPENSVIRLDALSEAETDALAQELQQNAMQLLMTLPSSLELPPALSEYAVDDESVASIDSVVGFREIANSEAGIFQGQPYARVSYKTADALADLTSYTDFLINSGWVTTNMEGEASNGRFQLATESAHDENLLMLTIEFTADSYSVLVERTAAALRRYASDDGDPMGEVTYPGDAPADERAKADPDVLARGKAALEAGAHEDALAIYDAALAGHPNVAAYLGGRGEALVSLGRYEEAMEPLNAAMASDPSNWSHRNERGVAYFYMDRWEDALADFEQAVALKPDHSDGYFNLAFVQRELGQPDNAVVTCALGLTVFPDSDDLWVALGDARSALGDDAGALAAYDRAISFGNYTPEDIPSYADAQQGAGG